MKSVDFRGNFSRNCHIDNTYDKLEVTRRKAYTPWIYVSLKLYHLETKKVADFKGTWCSYREHSVISRPLWRIDHDKSWFKIIRTKGFWKWNLIVPFSWSLEPVTESPLSFYMCLLISSLISLRKQKTKTYCRALSNFYQNLKGVLS